jgi:hypothetical protein
MTVNAAMRDSPPSVFGVLMHPAWTRRDDYLLGADRERTETELDNDGTACDCCQVCGAAATAGGLS